MCKKDKGIVMPNFAALAAGFPLSTKTSWGGGDIRLPVDARVKKNNVFKYRRMPAFYYAGFQLLYYEPDGQASSIWAP